MKEFFQLLWDYFRPLLTDPVNLAVLLFYVITIVINIYASKKYKTSLNLVQFKEIFDLVKEAEQLFPGSGRGAEKLSYVISKSTIASQTVVELVDLILSSPEKK